MAYNYMANILILAAIVSSAVAIWVIDEEFKPRAHNIIYNLCPPFGRQSHFEVETILTGSVMFGCAYMGLEHVTPLFHLWLERPEVQIDGHGSCNNTRNMDHFTFECLSRINPTKKTEIELGWQYISLLEHTGNENKNNKTKTYRCLVYDMYDEDISTLRTIRMVISQPVTAEKFDEKQCNWLFLLLGQEFLPMIPKGQRYWPDGSMYLYLLGRKAKIFYKTTVKPVTIGTNTTTSRPTTTTTRRRITTTSTTSRPTTTTTTSTTSRPTTTTTTSTTSRPTTTTTTTTRRPHTTFKYDKYFYSVDGHKPEYPDLVLLNDD